MCVLTGPYIQGSSSPWSECSGESSPLCGRSRNVGKATLTGPGITEPWRIWERIRLLQETSEHNSVYPSYSRSFFFGGKNRWSCDVFPSQKVSTWTKQYTAAAHRDIPAVNELSDWLMKNLPATDDEVTLVHGDFRLDNLIFHPREVHLLQQLFLPICFKWL